MVKNNMHKNALRSGGYSLVVTAVVLAILIAVNILASTLPATWTQQDLSSTQLYSVGSNTTALVQNLSKDVNIYWMVQSDAEWDVLENLLGKYESLSDHVDVIKKNPDVYPTFAKQYTDETVQNNSLIVTCGTKSRYIPIDDIYVEEVDYTTYSYVYSFNGEGAITSAIDYVTSDDLPLIYLLEGHGEQALPTVLSQQLSTENMETEALSLLSLEAVPEDADAVLIYAPQSDISEDEKTKLASYITVTFDKVDGMLSGMTADVSIVIEGVDDALLIPSDALTQTSSTSYVYTTYDEETGELGGMVEVTTGLNNGSYVEITAGLSEGDTVYYFEKEDNSFGFGSMGSGRPGNMGGGDFGGGMPDFGGNSGGGMPGGFGGFGG